MNVSWSGEGWQAYCRELLAIRHGALFQPVPDRVRGDWGIEGFTADGILYQCYAPEEPLTTKELYEKHRDKMTADIAKLRDNLDEVRALTPQAVSCWVLLVPRVEDKDILQHAARKVQEVLSWGAEGVSDSFSVRVLTGDDFPTERRSLGDVAQAALPVVANQTDDELAQFADGESVSVETLDEKLSKFPAQLGPTDLAMLRREFLRHYLAGMEMDAWVRRNYPPLWERWQHGRETIKRTLKTTELISAAPAQVRLMELVDELSGTAGADLAVIGSAGASTLAYGTVAGWMIDCPLDFSVTPDG